MIASTPPSTEDGCPHLWEDDHLVDAVGARLPHGVYEPMAPAEAVDARHAQNGVILLAVMHEDRQDEVRRRDVRLGYRAADCA